MMQGDSVEYILDFIYLYIWPTVFWYPWQAMARDEKNYYQDTPKQIKRKIDEYKRFHSEHYSTFMESLGAPLAMDQ